jgi:sucrose-6-phosphate hydrolase SacC (GH32 family)
MRPATRCRHIVDIVVDFNLETADNFGLKVRTGNGEETVIGYDVAASELYVDRTRSGNAPECNARRSPPVTGRYGYASWSTGPRSRYSQMLATG